MRKFLKEYFSFTRAETRIVIILSIILFILITVRLLTGRMEPVRYTPSENELELIREFVSSVESVDQDVVKNAVPSERKKFIKLHDFNPDKILVSDMRKMGFPERIVRNIVKYRESGGKFHKPEDIKRIYGMTDTLFLQIEPFIRIEEENKPEPDEIITMENNIDVEPVNINTADSVQLIVLKGIGPVTAGRIIKYREKLGGFARVEQLLEVYGMSDENYQMIKERIYINNEDLLRIDINKVSLSELSKHPYIDKNTAESIIKFRDFRGQISDWQELYIYNVSDGERLERIRPYIYIGMKK